MMSTRVVLMLRAGWALHYWHSHVAFKMMPFEIEIMIECIALGVITRAVVAVVMLGADSQE